MTTQQTFWLVWNERGNAPTKKHDSHASACKEAERLARLLPGQSFHVLELTGTVVKNDLAWTTPIRAPKSRYDETPF